MRVYQFRHIRAMESEDIAPKRVRPAVFAAGFRAPQDPRVRIADARFGSLVAVDSRRYRPGD